MRNAGLFARQRPANIRSRLVAGVLYLDAAGCVAKFAVAEVTRDCEEQVAAGIVTMEEDFREAVNSVFEALSTLQARLEEQEEALEEELDEDEEEL